MLWLPAVGALLLLLAPRENAAAQRSVALGVALLTFGVALALPFLFNFSAPGFQFVDVFPWIPAWGIGYSVSVDGVSLWLVLLTTLLTPIALAAIGGSIEKDLRTFLILMLLLETGMLGVFVAQDMFLFYIFFEITLIPSALLIGMWGGADRVRAATKYFLYTFGASVFMLLGIVGLYIVHGQQTQTYTFDIDIIFNNIRTGAFVIDQTIGRLLFGAFFIGFAVKAPIWPFHTWQPLVHTQAPNNGAVDALGFMLKIGGYGFIRFNLQLFPEASRWAAPAIAVLAVISIVYGAWVAYSQTDIKRMLAYSSLSHMGFVILGIFALNQQGLSGAVIQMVNIGLSSSALFFIVGMIAERRGTRELPQLGGLWAVAPALGGLTLVMVLASIGLPGLNGFIGEFAIMQGAWLSPEVGWPFLIPAVIGVILAAAYLLRMYRMTFMGEAHTPPTEETFDLSRRELGILVALLVPIVAIGLYPNLLFGPMQPAVDQIAQSLAAVVARVPAP
jgi:NADH-quinone oxidoreductase subunit M